MDTQITMIGAPSSKSEPTRIIVFDKQGDHMATVFCDGIVKFTGRTFYIYELDEITTIRDNFYLFYNSIEKPNTTEQK